MFELFALAVIEILFLLALRQSINNYFESLNGAKKRARLKQRLRAI
jgi:hypothetical protein